MFYARSSIADMSEMKVGYHCVDFTNHKDDYQRIMTHFVIYSPMPFVFDI